MLLTRRALITTTGAALALPAAARMIDLGLPGGPGARPTTPAFPGKREMIVQRVRPPLLETPMAAFDEGVITPNDRFFVRWNWDIPTAIDADAHRLAVRGAVRTPLSLTLDEVARAGEHVDIVAINQCAGNGRGFSQPRVTGTQWGNGAMGCAKWTGVRLRDVLGKAGIGGNATRVRFAGLDKPIVDGAPQFIKSIPIDIARRDDVLIAWGMNGEPLPLLHGFPLRIIVPGWFSTYWVKMLSDIEVLTGEDESYYVAKTYRMPTQPVTPDDKGYDTVPITTMPPRSFITSHAQGQKVDGLAFKVGGIAMGGDAEIASVDLLVKSQAMDRVVRAELGPSSGPFGFRRWTASVPEHYADVTLGSRCTNANGVSQPEVQAWNPSGYARNVIERIGLVT